MGKLDIPKWNTNTQIAELRKLLMLYIEKNDKRVNDIIIALNNLNKVVSGTRGCTHPGVIHNPAQGANPLALRRGLLVLYSQVAESVRV